MANSSPFHYFSKSGLRDLTPMQVLIIRTHQYIDKVEAEGRTVKDDEVWQSKVDEAIKKSEEYKRKRMESVDENNVEQVAKSIQDDIIKKMKEYDEKKKIEYDRLKNEGAIVENSVLNAGVTQFGG